MRHALSVRQSVQGREQQTELEWSQWSGRQVGGSGQQRSASGARRQGLRRLHGLRWVAATTPWAVVGCGYDKGGCVDSMATVATATVGCGDPTGVAALACMHGVSRTDKGPGTGTRTQWDVIFPGAACSLEVCSAAFSKASPRLALSANPRMTRPRKRPTQAMAWQRGSARCKTLLGAVRGRGRCLRAWSVGRMPTWRSPGRPKPCARWRRPPRVLGRISMRSARHGTPNWACGKATGSRSTGLQKAHSRPLGRTAGSCKWAGAKWATGAGTTVAPAASARHDAMRML